MERKNIWRRMQTSKVRETRVITGYIEFKHPEVYQEAKEFYTELNNLYPGKKDLRKTNEFEWIKTGFPGVKQKRFYARKTPYRKNKEKKDNSKTGEIVDNSKTGEIVDNMKLIIPLMDRSEKTVEQTAIETIPKTNQEVLENVVDMSADKEIEVIIEPAEVIIDPFPAIPDKALEDIIQGLREDPDLDEIFNELDIDIEFDEESPLERELAQW